MSADRSLLCFARSTAFLASPLWSKKVSTCANICVSSFASAVAACLLLRAIFDDRLLLVSSIDCIRSTLNSSADRTPADSAIETANNKMTLRMETLGQQFFDHFAVDDGRAFRAAVVEESGLQMIEAQQLQHRRMQVVGIDRLVLVRHLQADFVGRAVGGA